MAIHLHYFLIFFFAIAFGGSFAQNSRKELKTKKMHQDKMIMEDHKLLSERVDPSQVILVSWQPRVFLYKGFLTEEECDYLISRVNGNKSDGTQSSDLAELEANNVLSLETDAEIARKIEEKISSWTFLPRDNGASIEVLRFGPEEAEERYTYFDKKSAEQVGESLLATVILYLSNVSQGGHIYFPESENKMWSDCTKNSNILRPSKGNAIVFFTLHLNATPDSTSLHARCPVVKDEMWVALKFFYLKGIRSEKNQLQQSDDGDCTDEDENCPRWAAVGECQRNSVFMIGSPDYYGTCRKSCNAC